jgi:hypothetical protein
VNPPFEHFFDLGGLSAAEQEVRIVVKPEERARIAAWADLEAVDKFEALISLRKTAQNRFSFAAKLDADLVQSCVVSLVPVPAHIEKSFEREFHFVSHRVRDLAPYGDHPVSEAAEEGPEEIESTRYDLAAPLLEEFSLALDPYPRAPGVVFESLDGDQDKPDGPFAALKALKNKD